MGFTFPDVMSTTYVAGGNPIVRAVDLNALQIEVIRLWKAVRRGDLKWEDEFIGDVPSSLWLASGSNGTFVATIPYTSFGSGGLCVDSTHTKTLTIPNLVPIGAYPMRFAWRVLPSKSGTISAEVWWGLDEVGAGFPAANAWAGFVWVGTGNYLIREPSGGGSFDSGIAPTGTDFDLCEIWISAKYTVGGTTYVDVTYLINGVVISASGAYSITYPLATPPQILLSADLYGSGTGSMQFYIDSFKMWAERYPIAPTVGGGVGPGNHIEILTQAFTTLTSLPVTLSFVNAFADANYHVFPSASYQSSFTADIVPGFQVVRSTTGIQVTPTAPFNGTIDFLCFE